MEHDVAGEIGDGRLIQVLADRRPSYPGCRLQYPKRRDTPTLIVAFRLDPMSAVGVALSAIQTWPLVSGPEAC